MCGSVPLQLPTMTFKKIETIKKYFKFVCFIIDENLTWKNYTEVLENKIFENIGVLYKSSHCFDFKVELAFLKLNSRES